MIYRLVTIVVCFCAVVSVIAQNSKNEQKNIIPTELKNNPEYICGEGSGRTDNEADQQALANLMSQISVTVQSDFLLKELSVTDNKDLDEKSKMESVIRTYSAGILTDAKQYIVKHQPNAHVLRYIKKSELDQVFKEREERVMEYVRDAAYAVTKSKIDDALRYYYWAYCLLKSLPHYDNVKFVDSNKRSRLLINWIPKQMNDIFGNLDISIYRQDEGVIDLYVTYDDAPVTSVDFRVFKGMSYDSSRIVSVKDGRVQVELTSNGQTQLQLRYEYEYSGRTRQDKELEVVTKAFANQMTLPKSQVILALDANTERNHVPIQFQEAVETSSKATNSLLVESAPACAESIDKILDAIRTKKYQSVKNCFTTEGYDMFNKLINNGQASVLGDPVPSYYEMFDKIVCRSIPMQFSFNSNNRVFCEDVTFTFNRNNKIESVAFALDKVSRDDIFCKDTWPDSVRMVIVNFLENYQTAFALKRTEYIKSIFADDALIITGSVLKVAPKTLENTNFINNEYVKYTRQDKTQYIANLERCFRSNEYVNLHFTDTEVRSLSKEYGEKYGILIHQDYYSSTYSDTGYLFLVVSFNNPDQPTIQIRTWQPNRDPNINAQYDRNYKYWGLYHAGM